jgi:ribonuclease HI
MTSKKYYVVLKGRKTGIFTTWEECEEQIKGFSGAIYKSFKTRAEAEAALEFPEQNFIITNQQEGRKLKQTKTKISPPIELIMDSICVDASCLGNPGNVEYRGVYTATHKVIFHKSSMANGTNNLGEFLAIVHGLAYLKKEDSNIPIYSDSQTAILWVKNKKVRTKLNRNMENEELFNLVDRALKWLENNEYTNPVFKWDTVNWGEIPADFGRK